MKDAILKLLFQLGVFTAPPLINWGLIVLVDLANIEWHQSGSLGYVLFVLLPLWLIFGAWAVLFSADRSMKEYWRALSMRLSFQSPFSPFCSARCCADDQPTFASCPPPSPTSATSPEKR